MINYIKRNLLGNSFVFGSVIGILIIFIFTLGTQKGADNPELILIYPFAILVGIISTFIFYFKLEKVSRYIVSSTDGGYESRIEKITLFITGLVSLILLISTKLFQFQVGFEFLATFSIFVWMLAVLTREWPILKRIIWVVVATVIIVIFANYISS